jgi:hypothetical protein
LERQSLLFTITYLILKKSIFSGNSRAKALGIFQRIIHPGSELMKAKGML